MNLVKGIYHDGIIELIEKPIVPEMTEVFVIYPEPQKSILPIGGMFKNHTIDYLQVTADLEKLNREAENHILGKFVHE